MDICNNCKYFDMYSPRTLTGMCTCHDQYNLDANAPGCSLFENKELKKRKEKRKDRPVALMIRTEFDDNTPWYFRKFVFKCRRCGGEYNRHTWTCATLPWCGKCYREIQKEERNLIKNNDVQIKMKLNKKSDDDILSLLQLVNKQGYIKQLIRDDVKSGKLYIQFLR